MIDQKRVVLSPEDIEWLIVSAQVRSGIIFRLSPTKKKKHGKK